MKKIIISGLIITGLYSHTINCNAEFIKCKDKVIKEELKIFKCVKDARNKKELDKCKEDEKK